MKIQMWSIGKVHEASLSPAIDDFTRRINKYYQADWKIIAPPKNAGAMSEAELKKKEGEVISSLLNRNDYLVSLDERGKSFTSEKLAEFISSRALESAKQIIFLIGGAYGIDPSVLSRSESVWSLSTLTFPHQLVRLILAEQLYRACTIIRNEKYHHA